MLEAYSVGTSLHEQLGVVRDILVACSESEVVIDTKEFDEVFETLSGVSPHNRPEVDRLYRELFGLEEPASSLLDEKVRRLWKSRIRYRMGNQPVALVRTCGDGFA